MKKFNMIEANFLEEGLKLYIKSLCEEIKIVESNGKFPLMSVEYLEMFQKDILEHLKILTKK
jgi:hypothetical protein